MLPRSPTLSHNHGQTKLNDAVSRRHIPNDFSQQQWVETQLNVTNSNFRGNNLNGFPVISTTYQWAPRHYIPPSNPNRLRPGNRKRGGDRQDQYDLKKQRISSPGPYDRPIKGTSSSPAPRPGAGTSRREEARSDLFPPMRLPIAHKPVGYVPFLREESHPNARYSLPLSSVKDKLSHQILELFLACEQRSDDLEKKELCRAHLQTDIQSLFPTAQVFLAGSSLNGFGTRSSDADLCLVIQEGPVNQKTDAVYILSLVQKLLYKLSYIERPRLIRAKVPILKFRDKVSGVEFDLNVNNVVGIRNTFLLRTYAYIEKRVRPIILVIKKWASHHGINDASRGTLSSYTLVLMVLHYLQTLPEPVIPCLQMDYPECFSPTMDIHLVPTGPRNIPPYVSKNQSSLGDLFLGFLKYYATVFRWDKLVISVREAKVLPKPSCKEWRDKFICVEEPFDGSNTARAVHEKVKFDVIKEQFMESWQILQLRKDLNFILPTKETKPKR